MDGDGMVTVFNFVNVTCPSCGMIMYKNADFTDKPNTLECITRTCPNVGKLYKMPTIELEPVTNPGEE